MTDLLKYGDLVCYQAAPEDEHEPGPVMYLGACHHRPWVNWACIDIWPVGWRRMSTQGVDHKQAEMWAKCEHFDG